MKLTEAQRRFLSVIETSDGFLECRHADMRTHAALLHPSNSRRKESRDGGQTDSE